jgi:GTP cyclohydrolase IA
LSDFHVDTKKIERAVQMILEAIGENPEREALIETPGRVAQMYEEIFAGLHMDERACLSSKFDVGNNEMVFVRDITFHSMCEHHLIPFYGVVHIAYIPANGVVAGLSRLARVVDVVSKRPQVQERMTNQIADAIHSELGAQGVFVVADAEHMCMNMRGVKKPGSKVVTTAARGVYKEDARLRGEILQIIQFRA